MWISTAYAQAKTGTTGGDPFGFLLPLVLIFVVFWFFLIRPQQRRQKEHKALIGNLKRNDKVLTSGGIIGKVTKVSEGQPEVEIEIAKEVKVKVDRNMIQHVYSKQAPSAANTNTSGDDKPSGFKKLFGGK